MVKIIWVKDEYPKNLEIRQVYGIVFDSVGRILLRIENKPGNKKFYCFGGGTPESFDKDVEATLRREMIEEVNTTLKSEVVVVGHQIIENDGNRPPYAQLRMTALIDNIGEKLPDPDNGEIYDRVLVNPQKAIELLGWGEVGKNQIENAVRLAEKHFNLKIDPNAPDLPV